MDNVTLYMAPLRQRVWYRIATLAGYGSLLALAKYTPDLFVDSEETNPEGVEQWKRSLTGLVLVTWGTITNVLWYVYTKRIPSQIVLQKSQLWIRQLAIPSLPKTVSLLDILPTSRRMPKDNFLSLAGILEAKTATGQRVSVWLSEKGIYSNKSWLLNLVDLAARKNPKTPVPEVMTNVRTKKSKK